LSLFSIHGIVHSLLVPLYTQIPCLVSQLDDLRDFWNQMVSDDVSHALIDQAELRVLARRGAPRRKPRDGFKLTVFSSTRFSFDLFESFEERFGIELFPAYAKSAAGGVISGF